MVCRSKVDVDSEGILVAPCRSSSACAAIHLVHHCTLLLDDRQILECRARLVGTDVESAALVFRDSSFKKVVFRSERYIFHPFEWIRREVEAGEAEGGEKMIGDGLEISASNPVSVVLATGSRRD